MNKDYWITLYLKNGEKIHSGLMNYKQAYDLKKKFDKNKESYKILKNDNDVTLYFK